MAVTVTCSLADQSFTRTKSIGILNFSLKLLQQLAVREDIDSLTVLSNRTLVLNESLSDRVKIIECNSAISGRISRVVWDQWGLYNAGAKTGDEWLFLPKGFASFLRKPRQRIAAYVQDTIHSFYRERYPSAMPLGEIFYFQRCLLATLKYSSIIFTSSEFTRSNVEEAAKLHGLKTPPVIVAGIGFDDPVTAPCKKQNHVLLLASPWPNKRTIMAVDYLERWRQLFNFSGKIHVVGKLPADIRKPESDSWLWHPRLPAAAFEPLMAEARVLVYSTEYEGFGMPPIEAVLRGTCPVFSDLPVTREVMASAGFPFSNSSFDSFVGAMESAFQVEPFQLQGWKRELLARHSWNAATARILDGLKQHS